MVGESRDRTAYGVAFASLGLALAIVLIGVCWLSTERGSTSERIVHGCEVHAPRACRPSVLVHRTNSPQIPSGVWVTLALLGGLFVGALIPFPFPRWSSPVRLGAQERCGHAFRNGAFIVASIAFLAVAAIVASQASAGSLSCSAVGGLLLGLLIPSPTQEE